MAAKKLAQQGLLVGLQGLSVVAKSRDEIKAMCLASQTLKKIKYSSRAKYFLLGSGREENQLW